MLRCVVSPLVLTPEIDLILLMHSVGVKCLNSVLICVSPYLVMMLLITTLHLLRRSRFVSLALLPDM